MNDKVDTLLKELSIIGEQHYKPEYRTGKLNYYAVGLAIAENSSNALDFAAVAYAALEDWNHHSACAVLDWMFPKLHPTPKDAPVADHLDTLERVRGMIGDRGSIKVFTTWNDQKSEYNVETYRLVVTLEKV